MDQYEAIVQTIALTAGVAWASGINLYAVLLVLGLGGITGNIDLPDHLELVANPLVIAAAGVMYCVEFFADKIPGVDNFWDTLHTFIRLPAGALLAAGCVGDINPALAVAAGILGGGLAASTHATKASSRLLINTSPEPFSNWGASISEDAVVLAGMWAALNHPVLFLGFLVLFILAMIWLLPKLWRLISSLLIRVCRLVGLSKGVEEVKPQPGSTKVEPPKHALSHTELVNALERLQVLREKGALSDAEFEQQKQALIKPFQSIS